MNAKLLTGAQRRELEKQVLSHERTLTFDYREKVDAEVEPQNVMEARKIVDDWEESQRKKRDDYEAAVGRHVRSIKRNLLFDTVDVALQRVRDFETATCDDITWLNEIKNER